jgi:hypothetical protein
LSKVVLPAPRKPDKTVTGSNVMADPIPECASAQL